MSTAGVAHGLPRFDSQQSESKTFAMVARAAGGVIIGIALIWLLRQPKASSA